MAQEIQVKTILNKTKKRDPWFLDDYTINPYSSCSFNCLYCYIRGSKYGINLEEKLSVKTNALELLERALMNKSKKGQRGIIVLSSATDPYLPIEKKQELTRKILKIILKYRFPVHIITKSNLVIRDFDLLKEINQNAILPNDLAQKLKSKVFISYSFSSFDEEVAKIFEPGATVPNLRINALKETLDAGFYSGVNLMPILPYISDSDENLEKIFSILSEIKIKYLFCSSISLFGNDEFSSRTLILTAIQKHFPELLENYKNLFSDNSSFMWKYQKNLNEKLEALYKKYKMNSSLYN